MKSIFIAFILVAFIIPCAAQQRNRSLGGSLGYHNEKCLSADFFFRHNKNRFHVGASYQLSNKKGDAVRSRDVMINEDEMDIDKYFYSLDIGYSRFFTDKWNIQVSAGMGERNRYYNFKESGVWQHHVLDTETVFGAGGYMGYSITPVFEVYAGAHTLRGIGGGLRVNLGIK